MTTFGGSIATMQLRIDAQQALDGIEYALRSIKACGGSTFCTGIHAGQLARGIHAAADIGITIESNGRDGWGAPDLRAEGLREAKKQATELLKLAKADLKAIGGIKQLRLAFADEGAHNAALAA